MTDERTRIPPDAASRLAELRGGRGGRAGPDPEPLLPEAEEVGEEAFSTLSADRQQKTMLELRLKTGDAVALAYSYLVRADLNPSKEIVLDFSAYEVRVTGRNLPPLFSGLVAQRVAVIQESDELYAEATAADGATVVTRIVVAERDGR